MSNTHEFTIYDEAVGTINLTATIESASPALISYVTEAREYINGIKDDIGADLALFTDAVMSTEDTFLDTEQTERMTWSAMEAFLNGFDYMEAKTKLANHDAQLANLVVITNDHASNFTQIDGLLSTQNSRITALDSRVSLLPPRIETLEVIAVAHTERLDAKDAVDTRQDRDISEYNTKVDNFSARVNNVEITYADQNTRIFGLEAITGDHEERIEYLETYTDVQRTADKFDALFTKTGIIDSRVAELESYEIEKNSVIVARQEALEAALVIEEQDRADRDTIQHNDLLAEIQARIDGDAGVQAAVAAQEVALAEFIANGVGGGDVSTAQLEALETTVTTWNTERIDADAALQAAIDQESAIRVALTDQVTQQFTAMGTASASQYTAIAGHIGAANQARLDGDTALTAALNDETSARLLADQDLDARVTAIANSGFDTTVADARYYTRSLADSLIGGKENAFTKSSGFNKDFGNTAGTVAEGNDPRFSDSRTPTAHVHSLADITDFSAGDYASAAQGLTADSAIQPADIQGKYVELIGDQYIEGNKSFGSPVLGVDGEDILSLATRGFVEQTASAAASNHNHDADYAPIVHDHDSAYAPIVHEHDASYSAIGHTHGGLYSDINHNHDADYAATDHYHPEFLPRNSTEVETFKSDIVVEGNVITLGQVISDSELDTKTLKVNEGATINGVVTMTGELHAEEPRFTGDMVLTDPVVAQLSVVSGGNNSQVLLKNNGGTTQGEIWGLNERMLLRHKNNSGGVDTTINLYENSVDVNKSITCDGSMTATDAVTVNSDTGNPTLILKKSGVNSFSLYGVGNYTLLRKFNTAGVAANQIFIRDTYTQFDKQIRAETPSAAASGTEVVTAEWVRALIASQA